MNVIVDTSDTCGVSAPHLLFLGDPGTGKTSVARLIAEMLSLMRGKKHAFLVEASFGDLLGKYSNTVGLVVKKIYEQAEGGVLFLDEIYMLAQDEYGSTAANALVPLLTDKRRDVIVIAAGYEQGPKSVANTLFKLNDGLPGRFHTPFFQFPAFTVPQLGNILITYLKSEHTLDGEIERQVRDLVRQVYEKRDKATWANARSMKQLGDLIRKRQSCRIVALQSQGNAITIAQLKSLISEDILTYEDARVQLLGKKPRRNEDEYEEEEEKGVRPAPSRSPFPRRFPVALAVVTFIAYVAAPLDLTRYGIEPNPGPDTIGPPSVRVLRVMSGGTLVVPDSDWVGLIAMRASTAFPRVHSIHCISERQVREMASSLGAIAESMAQVSTHAQQQRLERDWYEYIASRIRGFEKRSWSEYSPAPSDSADTQ